MVFGVDEEDDAGDFGEVVFPEAAGCGGWGRGLVRWYPGMKAFAR